MSDVTLQPRLPFFSGQGPSAGQVTIAGRAFPVFVARHRRARRYVLRLNDDDTLRLTVPRGASIAAGLRFVARQGAWIDRERVRLRRRSAPWSTGTVFWFRGSREAIVVSDGAVAWSEERVRAGGDVRAAIESHMASIAARELSPRCLELARTCGLEVARVSVRNQRSRWGACSSRGVITLNWRLVQMPATVSDYVILHELTHLRHPNHSARFWRGVASVCPWWQEAERWLRKHGREIL